MNEEKKNLHDLHDFIQSSDVFIEAEYKRIRKNASEDPGTAGDQGEENWAQLLREWLPSYFTVVTKGRIITNSGFRGPQIDVLVLKPSYPPLLRNKKLYFDAGVVAAFECKITLRANDIIKAVKNTAIMKATLSDRKGTPYSELNSSIFMGLLAHSHSWKGSRSKPIENIDKAIWESNLSSVEHPKDSIDIVCVADLASWTCRKIAFMGPGMHPYSESMHQEYGQDGKVLQSYFCNAIGAENQKDYFSPLGSFLTDFYDRLAKENLEMRSMSTYFSQVGLGGTGLGRSRKWDLSVYSEKVLKEIKNGRLKNGSKYDDWSLIC